MYQEALLETMETQLHGLLLMELHGQAEHFHRHNNGELLYTLHQFGLFQQMELTTLLLQIQ